MAPVLGQSLRPIVVGLALGALGGYGLSQAVTRIDPQPALSCE